MSDVSLLVSEEYLEKDYFLMDEAESAEAEKTEKKIKFIKIIFCVLCFALLTELVIYKYVMPSFSSPKVTVTGQKLYSAEEIARMLLPMNRAATVCRFRRLSLIRRSWESRTPGSRAVTARVSRSVQLQIFCATAARRSLNMT